MQRAGSLDVHVGDVLVEMHPQNGTMLATWRVARLQVGAGAEVWAVLRRLDESGQPVNGHTRVVLRSVRPPQWAQKVS